MKYCFIAKRALKRGGTKPTIAKGEILSMDEFDPKVLLRLELAGWVQKCVVVDPKELEQLEADNKLFADARAAAQKIKQRQELEALKLKDEKTEAKDTDEIADDETEEANVEDAEDVSDEEIIEDKAGAELSEDEQKIVDAYQEKKIGMKKLAKKLDTTEHQVKKTLKKAGVI